MPSLTMFDSISLDGYFTDGHDDMSWAHGRDPEWDAFVQGNASGGGVLVFGRKTYDLMVRFWPTPMARQTMPAVAEQMNARRKIVFSRTLTQVDWANTTLLQGDLVAEMTRLKREPGDHLVILGSGSLVAQLTEAQLIDSYQIAVVPVVLGAGRSLFEGVKRRPTLQLTDSRRFANGNLVNTYAR